MRSPDQLPFVALAAVLAGCSSAPLETSAPAIAPVAATQPAGYRLGYVTTAWMNSAGHKANILSVNFQQIGIGVVANSKNQLIWTQDFTA